MSAAEIQELDVVKLTGTVVSLHGDGVATVEISDPETGYSELVDVFVRQLEFVSRV